MMGMASRTMDIIGNYHRVLESIGRAARRAGRDPHHVKLLVVTKSQSIPAIITIIRACATDLGENYVEEAFQKMSDMEMQAVSETSRDIHWHMIGHVQSRKAEAVATHFHSVHSLDSLKLARRLDRYLAEQGRQLTVLLEFNTSGESTKSGWYARDENSWNLLLPELREITELSHLRVSGLMTMAPYTEDPEESRPIYQRSVRLQRFLRDNIPGVEWDELSMGMSEDYQVAIEEGATWVRIGQAIFGPRPG